MTEVPSGGIPAENPFSLSREESIAPDTPPRGEGNQETLAVKAYFFFLLFCSYIIHKHPPPITELSVVPNCDWRDVNYS